MFKFLFELKFLGFVEAPVGVLTFIVPNIAVISRYIENINAFPSYSSKSVFNDLIHQRFAMKLKV